MTSTYLALFLGFLAPAFLGPAALNKSSILLELLSLDVGLPAGALAVLVFDADRIIIGGASVGNPPPAPPPSEGVVDLGGPMGGALARPASNPDGVGAEPPMGGPPPDEGEAGLAETERGMLLGGGGVAVVLAWASLGSAFLLTQRFCSGS